MQMSVLLRFHPLPVVTNFLSSLRACGKMHSLQAMWIYCVFAYVHIFSSISVLLLHTAIICLSLQDVTNDEGWCVVYNSKRSVDLSRARISINVARSCGSA